MCADRGRVGLTVQKDQPGDACWGQSRVDGPRAHEQEVSSWSGALC